MRTRQVITLVILVLTLGLHWPVLQSVAWVSMIVRYSRNATFHEALVRTFDGQHPCALCRVVEDGRKAEQQEQAPRLSLLKFDFLSETPPGFIFAETPRQRFERRDQQGPVRFEPPRSPPPRVA